MWRSSSTSRLLFRTVLGVSLKGTRFGGPERLIRAWHRRLSASASPSPFHFSVGGAVDPGSSGIDGVGGGEGEAAAESLSLAEAKKLMRLANVESLKSSLGMQGEEVIGYAELLEVCERMSVVRSREEAAAFARVLDEAGVVLLFRDKVYLHPEKVVDLVKKAVPLALTPESDPRREEMKQLLEKKKEIDMIAHRQVRQILWSGLGFFVSQVGVFFRLTFWEFSWDVMEPIAFFTTTTGLIVGYAYFLFTSRDPSYQDMMQRLFLSRQRKLIRKKNFNIDRLMELERHCKCPLDHTLHEGV